MPLILLSLGCEQLIRLGGPALVVTAMEQHPNEPAVQHRACWACITLATDTAGQVIRN